MRQRSPMRQMSPLRQRSPFEAKEIDTSVTLLRSDNASNLETNKISRSAADLFGNIRCVGKSKQLKLSVMLQDKTTVSWTICPTSKWKSPGRGPLGEHETLPA